jgi:thiol-disulfide isomerase/thioredoxin
MNNHFNFVLFVIITVLITILIYKKLEQFKNPDKVILFYTNWCKFSKKMLPVWEETTRNLSNIENPIISEKYDCDQNQDLCKEYDIKVLPTIYFIKNKKKFKYTDEIDGGQLTNFIMKHAEV